ncbi:MAG: anti-sigma factor, partial [Chloroflexota bacterium]|nr:anti-sigma factor [Chloroflexota bacterium]
LRGAVILPPNGAPFVVLRIPAPPAGRTWEAWVLRGDTPIPAGVSSAGGIVTITLTAPLGAGDGVAVTLEQAGGSSAPTTPPVLVVPRT